ncbi:MAG: hypothetical protein OEW58_12005 [Gammaproteobacteria bacterium]|nr:hypothetical protein [Gammaproteobacteria bacterium]
MNNAKIYFPYIMAAMFPLGLLYFFIDHTMGIEKEEPMVVKEIRLPMTQLVQNQLPQMSIKMQAFLPWYVEERNSLAKNTDGIEEKGKGEVANIYMVNAILIDGQNRLAHINGALHKVGDRLGEYRIRSIHPARVELTGPNGSQYLELN